MNDGTYIPFTSMSLRPYVLIYLLNEIIINNRKKIIEFGAGISTINLERIARNMGNGVKIVSVEENSEWFGLINDMLIKDNLSDYVTFFNVPLEKKNY